MIKEIKRYLLIIFQIAIVVLFFVTPIEAANDQLPEVMVGQTTYTNTTASKTYYGGFTGNEAVLNYNQSGKADTTVTDGGLFGFDSSKLLNNCLTGVVFNLATPRCFISNSATSSIKVMSSRTYVSGTPITETAALLYSPNPMIVGDAYLGGSNPNYDPNNFAFWGRNLTQSSGASSQESYWGLGGYVMNPNSQSLLSGTSYDQYKSKIDDLKTQATPITSSLVGATNWYLQGSDTGLTTDNSNPPTDANKYPEGKVWIYNDFGKPALGSVIIHGKGTIIFTRGFSVSSGANITKSAPTDSLGLITTNRGVEFIGNNQIYAAVFSSGSISVGANSKFYGSFVAPTFNINGGDLVHSNDQFFYDYKLDNNWPPGFRYLNMPHPEESN